MVPWETGGRGMQRWVFVGVHSPAQLVKIALDVLIFEQHESHILQGLMDVCTRQEEHKTKNAGSRQGLVSA